MARRKKKKADPVEALNRYARAGGIPSESISDMLLTESDRGLVIILGSWVEDTLLEAIEAKLSPLGDDELKALTDRGPLRDFNARIMMGRALGVVSENHKAVLETIKAMRNACAHSRRDITFRTPELQAVLLSLLSEKDRATVEPIYENPFVPRSAFITVCSYMLGILRGETPQEASDRINLAAAEISDKMRTTLEPLQGKPNDKLA
jgi:hypothetical protein